MIGALVVIVGLVLSLVGAVLKVELPIVPGLISTSLFGIGLFLVITGVSSFLRAIYDMLGPFWTSLALVFGTLALEWAVRTVLGIAIFAEILKIIQVNWPH